MLIFLQLPSNLQLPRNLQLPSNLQLPYNYQLRTLCNSWLIMFVDFLSSSTRFSTKWILSLGNSGSFHLNFRPFSSRVSISSLSSLLDSGPSFAIFYMTLAVHLRRFILSFFLYVSHIHFILCLYVCFDIYIFLFGLHCYLLMILMMDDCMCVD